MAGQVWSKRACPMPAARRSVTVCLSSSLPLRWVVRKAQDDGLNPSIRACSSESRRECGHAGIPYGVLARGIVILMWKNYGKKIDSAFRIGWSVRVLRADPRYLADWFDVRRRYGIRLEWLRTIDAGLSRSFLCSYVYLSNQILCLSVRHLRPVSFL